MSTSNYLENVIINHFLRNSSTAAVAQPYVALHTADPTETGATGEVSTAGGSAYVRKAATFGAPTDGVSTNSGAVTFDAAGTDWGTISYFSIWDAASAGNCLFVSTAIATPKAVGVGDVAQFAIGQITATLT